MVSMSLAIMFSPQLLGWLPRPLLALRGLKVWREATRGGALLD